MTIGRALDLGIGFALIVFLTLASALLAVIIYTAISTGVL